MATLNVQFTDASEETITSYFGAPQDPTQYPNQGTVSADDARWKAFYDSLPDMARDALPAPD